MKQEPLAKRSTVLEVLEGTLDIDALYARYANPLTSYITRLISDPERARELMQDTFESAWRHQAQYDERSTVEAWLYAIARHRAIDLLRRRKRVTWQPLDALSRAQRGHWLVDTSPDGGDPHATAGEREIIRAALAHLTTKRAQALLLYYVHGASYAQIATRLHVSLKGVKMLLCRARRAFRVAYEMEEAHA